MQNTPNDTPDDPPVGGPITAPTKSRRSSTARDMTISLVVLLIPLALIVALFRIRGGEDVVVIDPSAEIGQAQAAALFPVAVPRGLDEQWRPLSAAFSTKDGIGTLRVGYLTPEDGAVQFLQTNEDPAKVLPREFGREGRPDGQVTVDGEIWRAYITKDNQNALVRTNEQSTIVVQGAASREELAQLAQAVG